MQLVHQVGFIIKKFVSMHGPTNIKNKCTLPLQKSSISRFKSPQDIGQEIPIYPRS